ncbi:DUF4230 domain-containing protein (plasmid) [Nostoc sp. C052]|uniref:DUF4230 domain-containing protein n=1 Tax=Nostoc sp. C052 TaxID=2576902 RepID=UPI0015C34598|nr:DUF4230 domain-containing protein [Nostoc sp. C052]
MKNFCLSLLALSLLAMGFALNKSQILGLLRQEKPVILLGEETEKEVINSDFNIESLRKVGEIGRTVISTEVAIPLTKENLILNLVPSETKFYFFAQGEATSSIDLGELTANDIKISDDLIEIQLPRPNLRNLTFRMGKAEVADLQEQGEIEAFEKVTKKLCTDGILQQPIAPSASELAQILALTQNKPVRVNKPSLSLDECIKIVTAYPKN